MTLLAVFAVLLHRSTSQTDIVVGTNVANRTRAEVEGLIGFFVNNLVLRLDLAGDPPFVEVVRRVRTAALEAYAHQDVPFERLVEELRPARDASRHPLFQAMFVLQIAAAESFTLPGLELSSFQVEKTGAAFDLLLNMQELAEGIAAVAEYSTDLFERRTIQKLLQHFVQLTAAAIADPHCPISTLSVLGAATAEALASDFSDDLSELV